jgi:hypothetical protein
MKRRQHVILHPPYNHIRVKYYIGDARVVYVMYIRRPIKSIISPYFGIGFHAGQHGTEELDHSKATLINISRALLLYVRIHIK